MTDSVALAQIMALVNARQLPQAETLARQRIAHGGDDAETLNTLGMLLLEQDRALDEATALFGQALSTRPDSAAIWQNLAIAARRQGHFELAARAYALACERAPGNPALQYEEALCRLSFGDYEAAWPLYEARLKRQPLRVPGLGSPRWHGLFAPGQRLLVIAEQGLGDTLMAVRYLPFLVESGLKVSLYCPPGLVGLLDSLPGGIERVPAGSPLPEHHFHIALMSLPGLFRTRPDSIPRNLPYLQAPALANPAWAAPLAARECGVRVGLRWAGNRQHQRDRQRSCPPAALRPLLALDTVLFVSLQTDDGDPAAVDAALADLPGVVDARPWMTDMAQTAALIQDLNLVISVDTAVLHLAGALRRPAWALLDSLPDWRWGQRGDRALWYDDMLLFRQPAPGDWDSVVQCLHATLVHALDRACIPQDD